MQAFVEAPPYLADLHVFLGRQVGESYEVVESFTVELKRYDKGTAIPKTAPFVISRAGMLELVRSLTAECERLGILKPLPSEQEMKQIIAHRSDLAGVINTLTVTLQTQAEALKARETPMFGAN